MDIDRLRRRFPVSIPVPPELSALCGWLVKNGYPISGGFELREDDYQAIRHWFGTDAVVDRFGVFGAGPDGSLYALWRQDDGRMPVVHLGSEGQNNFVLAGNMLEFLRLLAIGYSEIGFEDLASPPGAKGINAKFQEWVRRTFATTVPVAGSEVVEPARRSHDDFQAWVDGAVGGG